jgi:chromate transporter
LLAYGFALIACVITVLVQQELTAIFLIAGGLGIVLFYRPGPPQTQAQPDTAANGSDKAEVKLKSLVPWLPAAVKTVALPKIFWFFFKTGFLVFGSGLVVVPFLKAYVVDQYHWISNQAFLDAVAVGIVSPGPVVITATFVGYLNHQLSGAVAATVGMFLPSLIFVLLGTPILRRYRQNGRVQGFIRGITVAVVGVLAGTAYLVARSSVHDALGLVIFVVALVALWSKWKVPEPALVGAGALCGLLAVVFIKHGI